MIFTVLNAYSKRGWGETQESYVGIKAIPDLTVTSIKYNFIFIKNLCHSYPHFFFYLHISLKKSLDFVPNLHFMLLKDCTWNIHIGNSC